MKTATITLVLLLSAGACVGGETPVTAEPAPTPARVAPPAYRSPISVPSAARFEQPRLLEPKVHINIAPSPPFTSHCDSTGCWGSDGTRYNAAGGMLLRPDGRMCREVAGVMQCP